jgi:hypothetical protein
MEEQFPSGKDSRSDRLPWDLERPDELTPRVKQGDTVLGVVHDIDRICRSQEDGEVTAELARAFARSTQCSQPLPVGAVPEDLTASDRPTHEETTRTIPGDETNPCRPIRANRGRIL